MDAFVDVVGTAIQAGQRLYLLHREKKGQEIRKEFPIIFVRPI
jgi:hypothetical protein